MPEVAELTVTINGKDVGLNRILTQLEGRMKTADATGTQLTDVFGRAIPAAQQKAADSSLRYAQTLARTAVAMGDNAAASRILTQGLNQAAGASDRAVASATAQLSKLSTGSSLMQQFGQGAASSLTAMIGPAALATAGIGALIGVVNSFGEALQFKAQLDATTASINIQLRGVRDTGEVWAQAASFARQYGLTQQEVNQAVGASVGILRTSQAGLEDILGVLARMQILSPEQSISEAALALKALASGDTTSLVTRFEVSRDVAAQLKTEIQGGRDAVQVMGTFLDSMGVSMDAVAAKMEGVNGKLLELKQAQEDLKLAQAAWAEGPGLVVLQGQTTVLSGLTRILTGDVNAMGQSWRNNMDAYATWLGLTDQAIRSGGEWGQVIQRNSSEIGALTLNMDAERTAIANATIAAQEQAAALEEDALKAAIAGVRSEELALKKNQLAQQAQIAANALLLSGAAGEQTANRLANSASLVDVLTASFYRLAAAQQAAAVSAARSANLSSQSAGSELKNEQLALRTSTQRAAAAKRYAGLQDAERDRIQAIGSATEKVSLAEKDLAAAREKFGASSAEAYRAETKLLQAQQASAKGGRAAHAAAGAGRVSDQQKMETSLLNQQDRFDDQAEQAEIQHQQKMLDIEKEFLEKSLQQQRENEVNKRQSRADFYKTLNVDNRNLSQQVRDQLAAAYEDAYKKAQEIAAAGNAQQADAYLKLKQEQLAAEAQFQRDLADAQKAKDDELVKALIAARELEKQAEQEREKQLLEGGDANVNARTKAMTEEEQRFADQQDKIGTSAEQAADRKIAAAQRSGQAIDAENLKLQQQEALLKRIGGGGGGGGGPAGVPGGPGAPAPGVAPTGQEAVAGGALDLGALASQLSNILNAINSAAGTITSAQRETTGAVRGLAGRAVGA
jgi:hypothetical protein